MANHPFDQLIELVAEKIGAAMAANAPKASGTGRKAKSAPAGGKRKRNFSPEGIARIRAAAKKRWAKWRKAKGG